MSRLLRLVLLLPGAEHTVLTNRYIARMTKKTLPFAGQMIRGGKTDDEISDLLLLLGQ